MIHLLWLSGVAALTIWMYGWRALRADDLGTVSARWFHEYRCDTYQNGERVAAIGHCWPIRAGIVLFCSTRLTYPRPLVRQQICCRAI
jgi:hypothetical protein